MLTPICPRSVSDGGVAYARPPRAHPRIAIRSVGARSLASLRSGAAISRKYENTTFRAQNLRYAFVRVMAASFEHFAPALQLLREADEVRFWVPETVEVDPAQKDQN